MTLGVDGSLVSVTVTEPRFTRAEKALLIASARADRAPRGPHGILLAEAMDARNQFAFEASDPAMDWAQKTLNEATEAYRKKNPKTDLTAVHISVRKRG